MSISGLVINLIGVLSLEVLSFGILSYLIFFSCTDLSPFVWDEAVSTGVLIG